VGDKIWRATQTRTSAEFLVAESFLEEHGDGVILEFEGDIEGGDTVADVSWISKFPSEREVLRGGTKLFNSVQSVEIVDGMQRVVLY